MNIEAGRAVITAALSQQVFPGAAVEAGGADGPLWAEAFGRLTYDDDAAAVESGTLYDLASLTKVVATATVTMGLAGRGRLDIDGPVREWLPAWAGGDRAAVTVRDLLEHSSGLPDWLPVYRECQGTDAFVETICRVPLAYAPRARSLYSDLGFILLGAILEQAGKAGLDGLFADAAGGALGEPSRLPLVFRPAREWRDRCAPTQLDDWRGRLLRGEVDDRNAWALGGIAAHAGLFGTAAAVGAFARSVLSTLGASGNDRGLLAEPSLLRRFVARSAVPGSTRALAWDTMCSTSSCGTRMSPSAIGHTGFTGTSLWIDPAAGTYVVLLSNRVHPKAADQPIQEVRRALHDALLEPGRF